MDLRALDIQFTALHLAAPEELRFRYKLEGFDQDWESETSERRVRYGRLPYGEYKFRVAARKTGGDWVEAGRPFAFLVPTPLYLTPVAIGLYVLTVIALVAGTVRVISHRRLRHALARAEQQQSLERERIRIARDMHDEIGSKLSKLSFLSERVRVDVAPDNPLAGKLETIAGTSRELLQTLDEIVWVVNPRNDNLEHLADYLGQYAREYFQNTNIECALRLPRTLPPQPVSAETRHNLFLAFEEALNNVLKHSGAARANVEMSVTPARFAISVTDNGQGFPAGNGATVSKSTVGSRGRRSGNGLANMRQRLESVGGQCVVENRPGAGVVVRLHIPLPGQTNLDS
jgi:signal transduction histidine kinase